jgi:hypothetical protein
VNKNYLSINFKSHLKPQEMLSRLNQKFPEEKWHGSDTDTQGPSLSALLKDKPHLQIFLEQGENRFCIDFSLLGLTGSELENYKSRFMAYIQQQVLPLLNK